MQFRAIVTVVRAISLFVLSSLCSVKSAILQQPLSTSKYKAMINKQKNYISNAHTDVHNYLYLC